MKRERNEVETWPVQPWRKVELIEGAGYRCMICGDRQRPGGRALAIDHDHESGLVRGVLCQPCNVGLGGFRDRIDLLLGAIGYLTVANEQHAAATLLIRQRAVRSPIDGLGA